ncbi:hypothetical protein C7974DRAFT_176059 [Boeremia exigua]|uniref:uncharacterized protein n=1 Tax=Boeremia exigua TaxID=749465 RepID=UPI001E8E2F6C|nr:uncharacterized protein C7974DRAFT_176059 [Boeremia exigua]KAH6633642.1 hypothetical protein C7974DRAFT_176059 [Boeremia exigua]
MSEIAMLSSTLIAVCDTGEDITTQSTRSGRLRTLRIKVSNSPRPDHVTTTYPSSEEDHRGLTANSDHCKPRFRLAQSTRILQLHQYHSSNISSAHFHYPYTSISRVRTVRQSILSQTAYWLVVHNHIQKAEHRRSACAESELRDCLCRKTCTCCRASLVDDSMRQSRSSTSPHCNVHIAVRTSVEQVVGYSLYGKGYLRMQLNASLLDNIIGGNGSGLSA